MVDVLKLYYARCAGVRLNLIVNTGVISQDRTDGSESSKEENSEWDLSERR